VLAYALRRSLLMIPTFVGVTFIAFAIMLLAPGDPVDLYFAGGLAAGAKGASSEKLADVARAKEAERKRLGLDRPVPVQYALWLGRLARLDLGESFKDKRPVWDKIRERLPVTITLNVVSILLTYLIAIPLGIYSSVRPGSWLDSVSTSSTFMLYSLPTFWVGTLILIFLCGGDYLLWFPPAGLHSLDYESTWPLLRRMGDYAWHLAMPVFCETYGAFAMLSRFTRNSMLENARMDYVRTARAKGVPRRQIIRRHALRNALIPFVTVVAIDAGVLLGGVVVVERIFSWPGLGLLFFTALERSDYPVILAWMAVATVFVVLFNLVADVLYGVLDPRIRVGGGASL
jgi:peptide/nickel transport system permease protein